jgi:hypothetical protein
MCYSGKCIWEDSTGNCQFPTYIPEVREKYPHFLCTNNPSDENPENFNEMIEEVRELQKKYKIRWK